LLVGGHSDVADDGGGVCSGPGGSTHGREFIGNDR
jgi:hypothetical protein